MSTPFSLWPHYPNCLSFVFKRLGDIQLSPFYISCYLYYILTKKINMAKVGQNKCNTCFYLEAIKRLFELKLDKGSPDGALYSGAYAFTIRRRTGRRIKEIMNIKSILI